MLRAAEILEAMGAEVPQRHVRREMVGDEVVGVLTSGNFSPVLGHGIALGFLPPSIDEGTEVTIDVRGSSLPGRVVPTPFVAKH